jgi:uncharacterized protein (DUF1684 family)
MESRLSERVGVETGAFGIANALDLLEWKHTIFDAYEHVRGAADPRQAWLEWRTTRDRLYRDHAQSPLPPQVRNDFTACRFHPYDPDFRVIGQVEDRPAEARPLEVSSGGMFSFTRIGVARFELGGETHELELTWNDGYGGGVFLAFRDATSGNTTYGGGRYLFDTVKGADLGFDRDAGTLVLDFNFAFNPSCSYDPRWACPLSPAANLLPLPIVAGEMHPVRP